VWRAAAPFVFAAAAVAAAPAAPSNEAKTAAYFASIRNQPPLLLAFLTAMPKGGDLHNHLSGAIYAESYLRWAGEDGLCLAVSTLSIIPGECDAAGGRPAVADLLRGSNPLVNQAIDAMSMRHWDPSLNGHDHFFGTFGKFGPARRTGDMLAEVTRRAAAEHVSYLELMVTQDAGASGLKAIAAGWDPDLPRLRQKLLAARFAEDVVTFAVRRIDEAENDMRAKLNCGTPSPEPGCGVTVRYIAQVARASAPEVVFAQMLAGFEIATRDSRLVSVNLVQPEDDPVSVRDFALHMRMLDYLHGQYPAVKLTLHAGELTEGLVAPEALRFHMRESVRTGHASRLGHGTGVMYEDDPLGLLRELAAKKVLIEVALSSSDLILGVRGHRHPVRTYLQYGVPIALVTDDAGVSRSTLTLEYRKAAEDQGLDYKTLKRLAGNSIEYCFADPPTKARLARELETAFAAFERRTANAERRTAP
jgi:hypothetical protein